MPMLSGYEITDIKRILDYGKEDSAPLHWVATVMEYEKMLQLQELNKNLVELTKVLKGKDMQGR